MTNQTRPEVEYITIVAPTAALAMDQFARRGLGRQGYSIAGQIGRHRISVISEDGPLELVRGDSMVAATFSRVVGAHS